MSEEIALAAADLATVEQLRERILEWEDCYDRLAGAFELRLAIDECHAALSDYAGGFYDVAMGALAERADYWRVQAQDVLTELHAAQATEATEHDEIKALLIEMRRYFISHNCAVGECVAWTELKKRFDVGRRDEADEAWMRQHTGQSFTLRRSSDERKRRNRE